MAATNAQATEKDKEAVTTPPVAAAGDSTTDDAEKAEGGEKTEATGFQKEMEEDPGFWGYVTNAASRIAQAAENLWTGEVPPAPYTSTIATRNLAAAAEAPIKPPEEKKSLWNRFTDGVSYVVDGAKIAAGAVADAVSDGWKKVFGQGSTLDITDEDKNGKADKVTVSQKDGDIITTDADKTVIKKPDGTIVTRDDRITTVEKNGVSISRHPDGTETFKLKDGSTGKIDENGDLHADLKALKEQITKDGVYGEIQTANRYNMRKYFNTHHNWRDLTDQQKDNDVVNAGDQSVMRVDKENGIRVVQGTGADNSSAYFMKDGTQEIVQIGVVDGQKVVRVGRLGADGKPDESSFKTVSGRDALPDWFKEHGRRNCRNGRIPEGVAETVDAVGVKIENGAVTVTHDNMKMGPRQEGGVGVQVRRGDGVNDVVDLTNVGGKQKVVDVANKQSTEWDGANTQYSQKNDGVEQINFNHADRHLKVYDGDGNLFADSTREGTRTDAGYIGADGSYTNAGGTKYFSQNAQEMQTAQNLSVTAIRGAEGQITSFRAALGRTGTAVDIGDLSSSMGSLTQALAMCIKSGNFAHLASIISNLGECQNLIAQGVQHNANVHVIKAAVPDAPDTLIAATHSAPNADAVAQLDKLLHDRRASA